MLLLLATALAFPPDAFIVVSEETWVRTAPADGAPGLRGTAPSVLRVVREEGAWLRVSLGVEPVQISHCQRPFAGLNPYVDLSLYVPKTAALPVVHEEVVLPGLVIDAGAIVEDGRVGGALVPPGSVGLWYLETTLASPPDATSRLIPDEVRCVSRVEPRAPADTERGLLLGGVIGGEIYGSSPIIIRPRAPAGTPVVWPDGSPAGVAIHAFDLGDTIRLGDLVCQATAMSASLQASLPGLRLCVAASSLAAPARLTRVLLHYVDRMEEDRLFELLVPQLAALDRCASDLLERRPDARGGLVLQLAQGGAPWDITADHVGDDRFAGCVLGVLGGLGITPRWGRLEVEVVGR
jgi:hypothetical protein